MMKPKNARMINMTRTAAVLSSTSALLRSVVAGVVYADIAGEFPMAGASHFVLLVLRVVRCVGGAASDAVRMVVRCCSVKRIVLGPNWRYGQVPSRALLRTVAGLSWRMSANWVTVYVRGGSVIGGCGVVRLAAEYGAGL
jgi:hypothetical protein